MEIELIFVCYVHSIIFFAVALSRDHIIVALRMWRIGVRKSTRL